MHGLTCCSSHFSIEQYEQNLDKRAVDAEVIGTRLLVVPWLAPERRTSADDWRSFADSLNRIGKLCYDRGFQLAYHHHAFEFDLFDGQTGFEILWSHTDPKLVKAELDVYWLKYAGEDLPDGFAACESRHTHPPQGHGRCDRSSLCGSRLRHARLPQILAAARSVGVHWGIVEQDDTYGRPPIESFKMSLDYLEPITPSPAVPLEGVISQMIFVAPATAT